MASNPAVRKFIRHPADVPIEVRLQPAPDAPSSTEAGLNNVGLGGLSFYSRAPLPLGLEVEVCFPVIEDEASLKGRVVWSRGLQQGYEVGVEFDDADQAYRLRMIEQICHIEHYRNEMRQRHGRDISAEQAAREWIERFAADFPGNS